MATTELLNACSLPTPFLNLPVVSFCLRSCLVGRTFVCGSPATGVGFMNTNCMLSRLVIKLSMLVRDVHKAAGRSVNSPMTASTVSEGRGYLELVTVPQCQCSALLPCSGAVVGVEVRTGAGTAMHMIHLRNLRHRMQEVRRYVA